jgi:signal transduction histidine kinase
MSAGVSAKLSARGRQPDPGAVADGSPDLGPLAHLLHELNQPLTGLQCSLELAAAGPRTAEQYLRAIRDGLGLVGRMRMLVEAVREVVDIALDGSGMPEAIALDAMVRGTVEDLRPVAESRSVGIALDGMSFPHLCQVRRGVAGALFRLLESAISLAAGQSVLGVRLNGQSRQAAVTLDWLEDRAGSGRPPFSPPDLGLLVARAAWQRTGGQWTTELSEAHHTVILSLPWAADNSLPISSGGDRS